MKNLKKFEKKRNWRKLYLRLTPTDHNSIRGIAGESGGDLAPPYGRINDRSTMPLLEGFGC